MLPMISNLDELAATKELLDECKSELKIEGIKFKDKIPLGVMIEVPSAALMADYLAQEVDFFSIGTNDLIQYTLAVDRTNEKLTRLYQSFNPAVLNLIKHTIAAAAKHKVKVGICGEMASDPLAVILFTGMGMDELSTSLLSTGMIKHIIRNINYKQAQEMASAACRMKTAGEVEDYLRSKARSYFPSLIPLIEFIQGLNHD
jgi:phosphotransferase system enzyme I (PtsI)